MIDISFPKGMMPSMTKVSIVSAGLLFTLSLGRLFAFQTSADLSEIRLAIESLRQEQQTLLQMIYVITKQLTVPSPDSARPSRIRIGMNEMGAKGKRDASVTILEFMDYQCEFCKRHFRDTVRPLLDEFVTTGKIRYVLRAFPLESIHPLAFGAAETVRCAGEQGKYWEMHELLMLHPLEKENVRLRSTTIGVNVVELEQCVTSGVHRSGIREDLEEGRRIGVAGTPTVVIGRTQPGGDEIQITKIIRGAEPVKVFRDAIIAAMNGDNGSVLSK